MKMQLVAVLKGKTCLYGGKRYKEAEHFYMTPQHAKLFCDLKQVQLDPAGGEKDMPAKDTRAPSPDFVAEVLEIPPQAPRARGRPRKSVTAGEGSA
jgi:hypothetical protein